MTVAVLGAGNWGRNHVRTLREMGALALVAEPHAPTRERLRADFPDVPIVTSTDEALKSDVRAVVVATPAGTHHAVARAALTAGKDVLVEKPMTLDVADAEDLARLAEASSRVLMVGHVLVYQPAIAFMRGAIREGIVGDVYAVHQERLNLGRVRSLENVLWSLAVHDVAVLLHLVGKAPRRVAAFGHRILQPTVEDDVHLHLAFDGGVQAHLHASWLAPERRRRMTVVGSRGMLVYDELAGTVTCLDRTVDGALEHHDRGSEVVFEAAAVEPLRAELEHFLERVRDRGRPTSDARQGVEVVRILQEATRRMVVA